MLNSNMKLKIQILKTKFFFFNLEKSLETVACHLLLIMVWKGLIINLLNSTFDIITDALKGNFYNFEISVTVINIVKFNAAGFILTNFFCVFILWLEAWFLISDNPYLYICVLLVQVEHNSFPEYP